MVDSNLTFCARGKQSPEPGVGCFETGLDDGFFVVGLGDGFFVVDVVSH